MSICDLCKIIQISPVGHTALNPHSSCMHIDLFPPLHTHTFTKPEVGLNGSVWEELRINTSRHTIKVATHQTPFVSHIWWTSIASKDRPCAPQNQKQVYSWGRETPLTPEGICSGFLLSVAHWLRLVETYHSRSRLPLFQEELAGQRRSHDEAGIVSLLVREEPDER